MKFENSMECAKSELDLFSVPPTQTAIEEGVWDVIQPHPNYNTSPVIRFDIPGNNMHYIDVSATEIYCKVKITTFTDNKRQSVVNNLLHSIFEQVQVYLNNVPVENSNKTYAYRAYLENLLCYGNDAKATFLASNLFLMDTTNYFDGTKADREGAGNGTAVDEKYQFSKNSNAVKRRKIFEGGKEVMLTGKLHCDIFNVNRYLLNNVDVKLVLTKAASNFYFIGNEVDAACKLDIVETFLKVRRVTVSPTVMLAHAMALEKTTAKYPIKRVLVKQFVCPYKSSVFTLSGIHFGIMPTRVVCGIVNTDAFAGTLTTNPFNFQQYGVNHLTLQINSKAIPYSSGIKLDWDANDEYGYIEGYQSLYKNIREFGNGITPEMYKGGCTLYAFDLTPDLCSADHYSLLKDGSLDLDVQLKTSIADSITFVFYLEFDNIIEITKERNILVDYKLLCMKILLRRFWPQIQ